MERKERLEVGYLEKINTTSRHRGTKGAESRCAEIAWVFDWGSSIVDDNEDLLWLVKSLTHDSLGLQMRACCVVSTDIKLVLKAKVITGAWWWGKNHWEKSVLWQLHPGSPPIQQPQIQAIHHRHWRLRTYWSLRTSPSINVSATPGSITSRSVHDADSYSAGVN